MIYAEPIPPIETKLKDAIKTEEGINISETEADDAAQLIQCNKSIPIGMKSSDVNISTLDEELEAKAERKRMRQEKRDRKSLAAKSVDSFDWLAPPPAHPAAHMMTSKSNGGKVESSEECVIKEEFCDIDVLPDKDEDEEEERLKEEKRCHRQERRKRKRARREAREMS